MLNRHEGPLVCLDSKANSLAVSSGYVQTLGVEWGRRPGRGAAHGCEQLWNDDTISLPNSHTTCPFEWTQRETCIMCTRLAKVSLSLSVCLSSLSLSLPPPSHHSSPSNSKRALLDNILEWVVSIWRWVRVREIADDIWQHIVQCIALTKWINIHCNY